MAEVPRKPTFPDHVIKKLLSRIDQQVEDNVIPVSAGIYTQQKLINQLQAIPKPLFVDYDDHIFYDVVSSQPACPLSACPLCQNEFNIRRKPQMCYFCTKWACEQCICHRQRLHPMDRNINGRRYSICYDCDGKYLILQMNHPYVQRRMLYETAIMEVSKDLQSIEHKLDIQNRRIDSIKSQPKRKLNMKLSILKKEELQAKKNMKKVNDDIHVQMSKNEELMKRLTSAKEELQRRVLIKAKKQQERIEKEAQLQLIKNEEQQRRIQQQEKRRQLEIQSKQRQDKLRIQRQREVQRIKKLEQELQRSKQNERRRMKEKQIQEMKRKEKQLELEKQRDKQKQLDKQRQREREKEKLKQMQVEAQRLKEAAKVKELEKIRREEAQKAILRQQEEEKQRQAEKQKQRQREKARQKEREQERNRQLQRQKQRDLEKIKQLEREKERQQQRQLLQKQKRQLQQQNRIKQQQNKKLAQKKTTSYSTYNTFQQYFSPTSPDNTQNTNTFQDTKEYENSEQKIQLIELQRQERKDNTLSNQPTQTGVSQASRNSYLFNQFKQYYTDDITSNIKQDMISKGQNSNNLRERSISLQQKQEIFKNFRRSLEEQEQKVPQNSEINSQKLKIFKEANKKRRNFEDNKKQQNEDEPEIIVPSEKCKCSIF